ncbi:MAG: hypothetical protein HUU10_12365 [Bacteroidetes bacterium]|nr:hypothetical protein [Bacteroidota bacterium]
MKPDASYTDMDQPLRRLASQPIPSISDRLIRQTLDRMERNQTAPGGLVIPGWQLVAAAILLAINLATGVVLATGNQTPATNDRVQWAEAYNMDVPTIYDQPQTTTED